MPTTRQGRQVTDEPPDGVLVETMRRAGKGVTSNMFGFHKNLLVDVFTEYYIP